MASKPDPDGSSLELSGPREETAVHPPQRSEEGGASRLEQRLLRMARRDFLTDLLNRYAFDERLDLAQAQARRFEHQVALLLIDLDDFKFVNDTHGHTVGDSLLQAIAARLRSNVREVDAIARLGGDEFAIIHTELGSVDRIAEFARRLIELLDQPFEIDGHRLHVTASIGIAVFPSERSGVAQPLLRQADLALYKAKGAGGGTFRFHVWEMDRRVQERMALQSDLEGALDRQEISLLYQPQVRLRDGAIVGAEALLRWTHPQRGRIDPREFIPIAEGSGQMEMIGRWVLRTAIFDAKRWRELQSDPFAVAVNLSSIQFRDPQFADWVSRELADQGLPPQALELELTEDLLLRTQTSVEQALTALRTRGVRFSLDDFGTGLSALNSLHRFAFDRIKIDQRWVQQIDRGDRSAAMVSGIIALADKLGLEVVAEGIETEHQADQLRAYGCQVGQGFLFSPPLSSAELTEALSIRTPPAA